MDTTGDAAYMTALHGDRRGAARLFAESLALAADLEARDRISWALLGAGNLAAETGAREQAAMKAAMPGSPRRPSTTMRCGPPGELMTPGALMAALT